MTQPIPQSAPTTAKKAKKWPWIVGIVIALFAGVGIGGSGSDTTTPAAAEAAPTVTVTAESQPAPTVTETVTATKTVTAKPAGPSGSIDEDGIFLVGKDVKAGTYKAEGGSSCYWARLSDLTGSDIIDNGGFTTNQIVRIKSTDKAFETNGCGAWKRIG